MSASFWCRKCDRVTQHRIDDRRKGPCLECIARLETRKRTAVHIIGFGAICWCGKDHEAPQQMEMELSVASPKPRAGAVSSTRLFTSRDDDGMPAALNPVSREGIPWRELGGEYDG